MKIKNSLDNFIWKCLHKINACVYYKSKVSPEAPWVYISYIPEFIYRQHNLPVMNRHQAHREMVVIVQVFKKLGYNIYVSNYNNVDKLPSINPSIIFGLEPSFEAACEKWPNALKIYYATGAYFKHQNSMIYKRTDEFNRKYNADYPYQRLVSESDRCEIADYIFQIGSKFTIETYPHHLQKRIRIIRQSNTLVNIPDIDKDYSNKIDYLWLGSSGTILKGLDLVIAYFKKHPLKTLHVVGGVDEKFEKILAVNECSNIKLYGFLNTSSETFIEIVKKSNFLVYPSCTEGGCPGAVINSMCYGLIPIVTPWAACNDIEKIGFLLENLDEESIVKAIDWTNSLSVDNIKELSSKCKEYVKHNYNLRVFESDMYESIKSVIAKNATIINSKKEDQ